MMDNFSFLLQHFRLSMRHVHNKIREEGSSLKVETMGINHPRKRCVGRA